MKYKQLKQLQAFQFGPAGAVYIRCRGGYRNGRGGQLIKFNYPGCPVLLYVSCAESN